MSALDLFASALGAFILITLILMPYFLKVKPNKSPEPQKCDSPPVPVCPACDKPVPVICPVQKKKPVPEVVDKFLVMTVEWNQYVDIDTYVQTPDGWYGPNQYKLPGQGGAFVVDNNWGGRGSVELWRIINPTAGIYTFCLNHYGAVKNGIGGLRPLPPLDTVRVKATLDKPTGPVVRDNLRFDRVLRVDDNPFPRLKAQMNCFMRLQVDANYTVSILG